MNTLIEHSFPFDASKVKKALIQVLLLVALLSGRQSIAADSTAGETDLPLPVWEPDEWQRLAKESSTASLGGLVPTLGEDLNLDPIQLGPALSPKYPDGPPPVFRESDPSSRKGLSLFLPDGMAFGSVAPEVLDQPRPTPLHQLRDVTPEFLAAVEAWPSDDPLIDPDQVLSETPAEDLRRFLGFHAENAEIPITVLVLAKNEKLPSLVALDRFVQGSLSRRRAALLVYPNAEPWRARVFLPRAAHEAVSAAFLSQMLEACLSEANRTALPDDQLHEYVVQLSIRLFWLQKELSKSQPSSQAFADQAQTPPLAEVGAMAATEVIPTESLRAGHQLHLPPASFITIAILLGFLLAVTVRRILHRANASAQKRQHTRIWTLPDKETPQRLGGAFCGGSGAWGSWK